MIRRRFFAWLLAASLAPSACAPPRDGSAPSGIVDDLGVAHVTEARHRIVSLVPGLTETLLEIGAGAKLVARTRYDTDTRIRHLPSLGGGLDPSLEALAALEPDLVVAWPDNDTRAVGSVLGELGIGVYSAETQTLADYRRHTRNLGVLADARAGAEELIAQIDRELAELAERLAGVDEPSVLLVVWHDPPQTAGPGTFPDSLLTAAGGRNAFADADAQWPLVGLEEIVRRQPDYVAVTAGLTRATPSEPGSEPEPGAPAETPADAVRLRDLPGWRDLAAVREGRVVTMEADRFMRPGPAVARAAADLARQLHPRRFP